MFKIAGRPPLAPSPLPVEEEELPEEMMPEEMAEAELPMEELEAPAPAKLPRKLVLYMGPEMGPFQCDNCCFYQDPGACQMVDGPIDPNGHCNVYCPPGHEELEDFSEEQPEAAMEELMSEESMAPEEPAEPEEGSELMA